MGKTYVWYSGATDVTGKKLMEALNAKGGTAKPAADMDFVICWGAKTDAKTVMTNKRVLNHPDQIRDNRNKLGALQLMDKAGVSVAKYSADFKKAGAELKFPVVARTKYHQGGKGFWLCLNPMHVENAIKEGANYIQQYIDISDEYRLHVLDGKVIYAVKKVPRDNHQEAFVEHFTDFLKDKADKNNFAISADTLKFVLTKLAPKFGEGTDMIVRSNTRGWKFSKIAAANLPKNLVTEATNAVKSLGLDFAAVDCCMDANGKAFVIECNSGPGLDGTTFDTYVASLKELIAAADKKGIAPAAAPAKNIAANPVVEKVAKVVGKKELLDKLKGLQEMLALAEDDDEVAMIQKMIAKVAK